jgi:methionine aminotransferase
MNDLEFAELLTKEFGIAVIPLSPFYSKLYNDKVIRICFAKRDEVLEEGMDRLKKAAEIILNNKSVTK